MSLGIDLVELRRIQALMDHAHWKERLFNREEVQYLDDHPSTETAAGMYAAKEAVSKALGTGIGLLGFRDIQILHHPGGQPYVRLSPRGRQLARERGIFRLDLSISHNGSYALAMCQGTEDGPLDTDWRGKLPFQKELDSSLLKRDREGYKTQYGKLAILGGSPGMAGSICLSSQAALRSGCGMVYTLVPEPIASVCQYKLTEAIVRTLPVGESGGLAPKSVEACLQAISSCDCLAIGPGLGRAEETGDFLEALLPKVKLPLVIDADALYVLAQRPKLWDRLSGRIVITPHEMEMARLVREPITEVRRQRTQIADHFSEAKGIYVVLKGADTVISNGKLHYLNASGNPGMATAGSGDVLTGIIGAFIAYGYQFMTAIRLAVYVHGLAGDFARAKLGEDGMIAGDLVEQIPYVLQELHRHVDQERGGLLCQE